MSNDMLGPLVRKIVDLPLEFLGPLRDLAEKLGGKKRKKWSNDFKRFLRGEYSFGVPERLARFKSIYGLLFGINCDFSNLHIPKQRDDFNRLLVMPQGITPQRSFDGCAALFPSRKWRDINLDGDGIVISDRSAKGGAYAIWVRDCREADEKYKYVSGNDATDRNIKGETLEERFIHEIDFFLETGSHLDLNNNVSTICTGSSYYDGGVPDVQWLDSEMRVGGCHPIGRDDDIRLREVVSI